MYRLVHTKIWRDNWFYDLSEIDKLVYIYLITSPSTSSAGIIRDSIKLMSTEIGISQQEFRESIRRLSEKVLFFEDRGIIYIKHFFEYQLGSTKSKDFKKAIIKDLTSLDEDIREKIFLFDPPIGKLFRPSIDPPQTLPGPSIDPPTRVSTETETVTESVSESETESVTVTETEAQKNLNFNFSVREKEATEKIIAILNKNSGNEDNNLAEKIKEYIPEPADRVEVARVLSDICKGGLWQRRLKTVEDIPRYWNDIVQLYKAKPVAFSKGGGDGCKPDVDFKTLMENFKNSRRLE